MKWVSSGVDKLRRPGDGLVILIFHRVGGNRSVSVDLPLGLFVDQIAYLAEHFQPLTLDDAADRLGGGAPPPGKPAIVVTFDDGTADFADQAVPVLADQGVPATLYVATDHVERDEPFPHDGRPISWAGLADAVSTGLVTVGSHTHTHRLLDRVQDSSAIAEELDRSTELIGERLGIACRHFAYPKALLGSPEAEREVRDRFRTAAIAGTRPNKWRTTDLHRLNRSPIQVTDGLRWFRAKAAGGLAFENDVRDLLNRGRYAGSVR